MSESGQESAISQAGEAIIRNARRLVVAVVGTTVILLGLIMLVAPGPGIVGVLVGLGILATEFVWARVWLKRAKRMAKDGFDQAQGVLGTKRATDDEPEN